MTLVKVVDRSEASYQRFQPVQASHRTLPKIKLQQVHAVFLLLDTDRDGLLTGAEIMHGGRLLGLQLHMICDEDSKDVPTATFEQFGALVADAMHRDHNAVDDLSHETSKLFSSVDKFGKGVITPDALFAFFKSIGDDVPKELVDAMMDAMDTDLNGEEVSEAELRTFLETCNFRAAKPTILRMPRAPFSLYTSKLQELLDSNIDASTERPPIAKQDTLLSMVELRGMMAAKRHPEEEAVSSVEGDQDEDGRPPFEKPDPSSSGLNAGTTPLAPSGSPSEQRPATSEADDRSDDQSRSDVDSFAGSKAPSLTAENSADDSEESDED